MLLTALLLGPCLSVQVASVVIYPSTWLQGTCLGNVQAQALESKRFSSPSQLCLLIAVWASLMGVCQPFLKEPDGTSNILGFAAMRSLTTAHKFCHCRTRAARDNMQMKGCGSVLMKLYLQKQAACLQGITGPSLPLSSQSRCNSQNSDYSHRGSAQLLKGKLQNCQKERLSAIHLNIHDTA